MPRSTLLQWFRVIHLYTGVFIAPAILFFALTGALQTFGLHETNRDHPDYKPARWIATLAQIHKKQSATMPPRRPQPTTPAPSTAAVSAKPATPQPERPAAGAEHHPLPLRIFFLVVCVGLFTSTLTGVYMSYKYLRNRTLITGLLVAGIVLPLALVLA